MRSFDGNIGAVHEGILMCVQELVRQCDIEYQNALQIPNGKGSKLVSSTTHRTLPNLKPFGEKMVSRYTYCCAGILLTSGFPRTRAFLKLARLGNWASRRERGRWLRFGRSAPLLPLKRP